MEKKKACMYQNLPSYSQTVRKYSSKHHQCSVRTEPQTAGLPLKYFKK